MNTINILIKNGIIVTMDSQRRIIDGGAIAIENDKIIDIGPSQDLEKKHHANETIDAAGMLVLPGLINAHNHTGISLARGVGDDLDLMEAHRKIYFPLQFNPPVSAKAVYHGALLSCLESIKTGVTCIIDQYSHPEEVAKAVEITGIRGVLSPFMVDTWLGDENLSFFPDTEKVIDDSVSFIQEWNGKAGGRIKAWFGPMHETCVSKELFTEVVALAEKYNVGIHVHLAETNIQVQTIKKMYGKRSIEYAYDLGVLRPGTVAAHCCWLSEHDITLMAKSGASVAHAPGAEMKLSDGIEPTPGLLEAGVNVTLGTDYPGDLIQEMKTVGLLHKINYPLDPEYIPAETVLEMVTVNGAKATLWQDEIGSLEKGKKADITIVDLKKPHLTPVLRKPKFNVVSLLVYNAAGSDVDTVIVDGKILMRHRKVLTIDEAKIMEEAQAAAEELLEQTGVARETLKFRWSA